VHALTICGDEVHAQQLVDAQPVPAHEPAESATEGQPSDPRVGDDAGWSGQTVGLGRLVEFTEQRTRLDPCGALVEIDVDVTHQP
jgi:hypothetical protein